jgi:anti-sigma regulatory factor (Ser/Thr protein kinase)
VTLVLRDFDPRPYDVTRPRDVSVQAPLHERRAGGLGLHLVQRMADGLEYRHDGRSGTITVTKRLSG